MCADVVVIFDLVIDRAVDMSATFVIHVDDSTIIIFLSIATIAPASAQLSRDCVPPTVNDKGGAHVHGADCDNARVNDNATSSSTDASC